MMKSGWLYEILIIALVSAFVPTLTEATDEVKARVEIQKGILRFTVEKVTSVLLPPLTVWFVRRQMS